MTPQELIAIIEQSPELQKAMRRYVLTDEFLAIPARLDRMESDIADLKAGQARMETRQDRMESDIADLKAGQARMEARQDRMEARQDRMESDIADLKAGQARLEARQDRMESDIADMKAGQARMEDRMDKFDGRLDQLNGYRYEQKAIKNCRSVITQQTGMGRVKIRFSQASHHEDPEMVEGMDLAADRGEISQEEEASLWSADLIVSALDRTSQERVNIVVEASISLGRNDLERAKSRAATLEKATGERTLAAVICARADEERIRQAGQDKVIIMRMPDEP